jgi:hypothetical protein
MQALRNLFKNDLVLVGTNLTVVAGFATYLGIIPSLYIDFNYEARHPSVPLLIYDRLTG